MQQRLIHRYRPAAAVRACGEDAFSFMQSQATQDLRLATRNAAVYTLWLDHRGKVVGDSFVFRESEEALLLVSLFTPVAILLAHWQKHIVADEVELEDVTEQWFGLACNDAAVTAFAADGVNSSELKLAPGAREKCPWSEVFVPCESTFNAICEALLVGGSELVDASTMEMRRIVAGCVRVPVDIGAQDLPAEGGLVAPAVSFNKGCFLGQEVVARMHHVGRPRRGLFRLRGSGALPPMGAELMAADSAKAVGELRSGVSLEGGAWAGLALCVLRRMEDVSEIKIQNQLVAVEAIDSLK
jgi:folate-binding protein YgfZ